MKYLLLTIAVIYSLNALAQSDIDALRYSSLTPGGTARALAIGGSFGAIGADFSTLSTNPAGLGGYRSGSLMFSPVLNLNTASSEFGGNTTNTFHPNADMYNMGIVNKSLSAKSKT